MRYRNTIAHNEIARYIENDNCYIPRQFVPNRFVQFAADNINILEETLDKSPTFHETQIVAFQKGPARTDMPNALKILPYNVKLDIPENSHLLRKINYNKSNRAVPDGINKDILLAENEKGDFIRSYNFSWILCRTVKDESNREAVVPQWSGFSKLLHDDNAATSVYGCLPLLP